LSFNIGGNPVQGIIVNAIQTGKERAQEVVQQMVNEVKNDPAKNLGYAAAIGVIQFHRY
jgi:ElaB/YqjD/DUF883 family membrane-anchored ribosome-binding protein